MMLLFQVKKSKVIGRLYVAFKCESELSYVEGKKGDRRYHFIHFGFDKRVACEHQMTILTATIFFLSIGVGLTPPKAVVREFFRKTETTQS